MAHMSRCLQKPEEDIRYPELTDGHELSDMGGGNQSWLLWKEKVFLTAEPSLYPGVCLLERVSWYVVQTDLELLTLLLQSP